jgi:hypothetical protein
VISHPQSPTSLGFRALARKVAQKIAIRSHECVRVVDLSELTP